MKAILIILLIAIATHTGVTSGFGQSIGKSKQELNPTLPNARTPEFDNFIERLQGCKGPLRALAQWSKVVKPTLDELGYSEQQVKSIRKALTKDSVTIENARDFSRLWLAKYSEQITCSVTTWCRVTPRSPTVRTKQDFQRKI